MSGFTESVVKKLFLRRMREVKELSVAREVRAKSSLRALRVMFEMREKKRKEPPSMQTNLPAFDWSRGASAASRMVRPSVRDPLMMWPICLRVFDMNYGRIGKSLFSESVHQIIIYDELICVWEFQVQTSAK